LLHQTANKIRLSGRLTTWIIGTERIANGRCLDRIDVKLVDQAVTSFRRVKLAHRDDANGVDRISITGTLGSGLIGLRPGQAINWGENEAHQRVTVLETINDR
jgi:hypothetical protein